MKPARIHLAIVVMLAVAACGRQPGKSAAGDATTALPGTTADGTDRSVPHDPRAMTSIDAATGDLAGLANYGNGLAVARRPSRAGATLEAPAVALLPQEEADQPVVADQQGQTGPAPSPTMENATGETEQANLSEGASADRVQPIP